MQKQYSRKRKKRSAFKLSAVGKKSNRRLRKKNRTSGVRGLNQEQIKQQEGAIYDQGYNNGYNKGHDDGYNLATKLKNEDGAPSYDTGYDEGFNQGLYAGGDGIVDELLPHHLILPEYSIRDIISHGIAHLESQAIKLLDAEQVKVMICQALEQRAPLSLVRIGDGELLTLSQDLVLSTDEVRKKGDFLDYAGVAVPDLQARNELARSVRASTIIGIPKLRLPNFLPLMNPAFQAHGLDYKRMQLTLSTINYELYLGGHLPNILGNSRILAIGKLAAELSAYLAERGYKVVPPITQVNGMKDVERTVKEAATRDYDLALVSAGIPAVIITQQLATNQGKVAIDFGHLADSMVKGEAPL